MGKYVDKLGNPVEMDDAAARLEGLTPYTAEQQGAQLRAEGDAARGTERGWVGKLNAGATGALSALTLGGSDYMLGSLLTDGERERALAEIEGNPGYRTAGELGGTVLGALAAPGGAVAGGSPAGYLGATAGTAVEEGLARGGVAGNAAALGVMGTESAIQNAGQYLGRSALEDKETTVEGFAGALGTGFEFGVAGGGAALGVSKGTIAARKLYSKLMDGSAEAVADAANTWTRASQELLDADQSTYQAAKQEYENIQAVKAEAKAAKQRADVNIYTEQARATASDRVPVEQTPYQPERYGPGEDYSPIGQSRDVPSDYNPMENYNPAGRPADVGPNGTKVVPRGLPGSAADVTDEMVSTVDAAAIRDHGYESLSVAGKDKVKLDKARKAIAEGQQDPIKIAVSPGGKYHIEDGTNRLAAAIEAGKPVKVQWYKGQAALDQEAGRLEQQLAGTKQALDAGVSLKDIGGEKPASFDDFARSRGFADSNKVPPYMKSAMRAEYKALSGEGRSISRLDQAETKMLLGEKMATREAELHDALAEFEAARHEFANNIQHANTDMAKPVVPFDFAESTSPSSMMTGDMQKVRTSDVTAVRRAPGSTTDVGLEAALTSLPTPEPMVRRDVPRGEFGNTAPPSNRPAQFDLAGMSHSKIGKRFDELFDSLDNLPKEAEVISRYEKAGAKLSELTEEAAHPVSQQHAKALADAEDDTLRQFTDRQTRAAEDHETFGPPPVDERHGPTELSGQERVQYARDRKLDAKLEFSKLAEAETNAKATLGTAKKAYDARAAEFKLTQKAEKAAGKGKLAGKMGTLANMGSVAELFDIPGMPKPHDLPVVGPLLGAYLKMRGIKAALGKMSGKVTATADVRVGVLASKVKNRIAESVDRSLGLAEKASKAAVRPMPSVAGVIGRRLFDDGEPDVKEGGNLQEAVAVRTRELAAYVTTPGAIERDVRREMRDVMDPDLIAAAEAHRRAAMQHLLDNAPKVPDKKPLDKTVWLPSPAVAASWARRYEAVDDPASVFEQLAHERASISLEAAETLRKVYPQMFALAQQRMMQKSMEIQQSIPYAQRARMSLLYGIPLDASLEPDNMKVLQTVYQRPVPVPPPGAPQQPMPSVAGQTNLTALFQTTADRRAAR